MSRVCLGCMGFGDAAHGQHSWTLDEEHSREIIKRGLELGINFFDTAIGYQSGTSEQYLGSSAPGLSPRREDVVVATKFLPRTQEEIAAGITGQQHIRADAEHQPEKPGAWIMLTCISITCGITETPLYDIMEGLNRMP